MASAAVSGSSHAAFVLSGAERARGRRKGAKSPVSHLKPDPSVFPEELGWRWRDDLTAVARKAAAAELKQTIDQPLRSLVMIRRFPRIPVLSTCLFLSAIGIAMAVEPTTSQQEEFSDQGSYKGIPWVSGGVGESSRDELMKEYDDYNLRLEFAVADGNYLADVAVTIRRPDGEAVLRAFAPGPWLITKLAPGSYEVTVNGFDETFVREVSVPAQGMETVLFNEWTKAGVAAATPGPSY